MLTEWLLYLLIAVMAILAAGSVPVARGWLRWRTVALVIVGSAAVFAGVQAQQQLRRNAVTAAERAIPSQRQDGLFAGSSRCRACHIAEYETWHASFHRTMTQVASPATVVAPFDGRELSRHKQTVKIFRQGDEFWAQMQDPELTVAAARSGQRPPADGFPTVDRQIVMTTGSHEFQAYWFVANDAGELWQFPWRYNIADDLWMHRDDVFLQPPTDRPALGHQVWNGKCIHCHSVAGQPGLDHRINHFTQTRMAEPGIACEACHGPCAEHASQNSNPARRYQLHFSEAGDATVKNPARLSQELSAQACGACHSHYEYDQGNPANDKNIVTGREHRPGIDLRERLRFLTSEDETVFRDGVEEITVSRFWDDGTCRSGGREYNGMVASACYINGNMTCLSCHAMHGPNPDGQLRPNMSDNQMCGQCHTDIATNVAAHSHHAADSSGSNCMNCHMPYTSFALLKGIRSHKVDSPSARQFGRNRKLNACNLCHLDQTLAWTADKLQAWYDVNTETTDPTAATTEGAHDDHDNISAAVRWLLKGDAGQRVISAWHMKWPPAREVSGTDWMTPYLTHTLNDPYAAVRFNAAGALGLSFREHEQHLLNLAISEERSAPSSSIRRKSNDVPTAVDYHAQKHLHSARNNRPMVIVE